MLYLILVPMFLTIWSLPLSAWFSQACVKVRLIFIFSTYLGHKIKGMTENLRSHHETGRLWVWTMAKSCQRLYKCCLLGTLYSGLELGIRSPNGSCVATLLNCCCPLSFLPEAIMGQMWRKKITILHDVTTGSLKSRNSYHCTRMGIASYFFCVYMLMYFCVLLMHEVSLLNFEK